jgi:hypothetical protein
MWILELNSIKFLYYGYYPVLILCYKQKSKHIALPIFIYLYRYISWPVNGTYTVSVPYNVGSFCIISS